MDEALRNKIDELYKKDQDKKIVELILGLPEDQLDVDTKIELAVAYNNTKKYPKAVKILKEIEKDCADQPRWYYIMGYAHVYNNKPEKALPFLEQGLALVKEPDSKWQERISDLLDMAKADIEFARRLNGKEEKLPEDFFDLMIEGDFEKLKGMYDKCGIVAHEWDPKRENRWRLPFFYATPCSEFYQWLVDQGLDINIEGPRGESPLTNMCGKQENNVEGLLKAGADIRGTSRQNPLSIAVRAHLPEVVETLLRYGADVNAEAKHLQLKTPLDVLLVTADFKRVDKAAKIAEMLLQKGAKSTVDVPACIKNLGGEFEFRKTTIDPEKLSACEEGMKKMYELFHVTPVDQIIKHDGKSPITVEETDKASAFGALWDYLVPANGKCETVQGEVIRICGNVRGWLLEYGGDKRRWNWRDGCGEMFRSLPGLIAQGGELTDEEQTFLDDKMNTIGYDSNPEDVDPLRDFCVDWVRKHPAPIPMGETAE